MNRQKFITILSVMMFLLLGGILAACSDGEPSNANGGNDNGEGNSEENGGNDNGEGSSEEKEEINFFVSASTKPDADRYVGKLEEISGYELNFEYVAGGDYQERLATLFASGDLPDVVQLSTILDPTLSGALEAGAFTDLTDLIDEHGENIKKNIPEEMWKSPKVSKDGKIYALPRPSHNNVRSVFMRKDWLEQLDMEVPKTLDDWLEYHKAVQENNMNGNGDAGDEHGYYTRDSSMKEMFFGAFGVHPASWKMTDGEMIPDIITPEMKEALAFYIDIYEKGYVNEDMFTLPNEDWINAIYGSKAGSWEVTVNDYLIAFSDERDYGNLPDDGEFMMVPAPKGPNGESGLNPEDDGISGVWVIPSDAENAEAIVKYWDWAWSSEDAENFFLYGIKDHNYEEENGEITYDPLGENNIEDFNSSLFHAFLNPRGTEHVAPGVLDAIGEKGEDVRAAIEDANEHRLQNDAAYMPTLDVFMSNPELIPGLSTDSLFQQLFAKVVTGSEDLDTGFDDFVETWKRNGGDEAIEEATNWYNDFYGN